MNNLLLTQKSTPSGYFLLDGDASVARTFARNPNSTQAERVNDEAAYAKRIALCVSTCHGKTNEQLESFAGRLNVGTLVDLWSDYLDLKQENSELREAATWKPIEDAPKGIWIIVQDENGTAAWQACWDGKLGYFVAAIDNMPLRRAKLWMHMPVVKS